MKKDRSKVKDTILSKQNTIDYKDFESIMPTALHTLYPLIYTDIPYIKEMFEQLDKLGFPESLKNKALAIELEARYKLADKFLADSKINQVVELACGYTTRGLSLCQNNNKMKYIEVDLPDIINTKTMLLNNFVTIPENLLLCDGNALDYDRLKCICNLFEPKRPIAVINHGLMRYLNFDEKRQLAENIYKIISKNNGVWITCDVTPGGGGGLKTKTRICQTTIKNSHKSQPETIQIGVSRIGSMLRNSLKKLALKLNGMILQKPSQCYLLQRF